MSFKGAASALLVIIVLGMVVGGMLVERLSGPASGVAIARGPASETPDPVLPTEMLLPEGGEDLELATPAGESQAPDHGKEDRQMTDPNEFFVALRAWEDELQNREDRLQDREQALATAEAELEAMRSEVERERRDLGVDREQLAGQQGVLRSGWAALDGARDDLAGRERRAQALAGWGGAALAASAATSLTHAAVVAYRRSERKQERPASPPENEQLRRARLRPIRGSGEQPLSRARQPGEPAAVSGSRSRPEEEQAVPAGEDRGNGHHSRRGRVP
jgi:hypothetical protein